MKTAADLLIALRALLPELTGSLTLDKETGSTIIVTLCDQSAHAFQSFKLDPNDLTRPADDIARDIVAMREVMGAER